MRRPTDLPVGYDRGANPGTLMAQLALQYSALNHCDTREAVYKVVVEKLLG